MNMNRFDIAWPWIGGAAALVLLVLLFGTDLLRSEKRTSRWRDRVWLAWMAAFPFLIPMSHGKDGRIGVDQSLIPLL
ncbi:MAG: hypothetical protein HKP58_15880 [Desulfatitalea sp.]|nr:hypothetical protein [Desulfatitalea sp.]NNK01891.1 hypothetical protein [Desulfatitalea sp.]